MTRSRLAAFVLGALLAATPVVDAGAQIGGLIKRKVADAVKGPEEKKADAGKKSPFENADILEITQPVLDGFMRGVRVEIGLRKEFTAELAQHPTREQRTACEGKLATSPEMQKYMEDLGKVPEKATAEEAQKYMQKLAENMTATMRKKCPADVDEVWPNGKRTERMDAIRAKAAETAGVEAPSSPPDNTGAENESAPIDAPAALSVWFSEPGAAAGITVSQYNILLERIKRFCDQLKITGGDMSGGIKIPGTGKDIYWVYTPSEAATLTAKNCQAIYDDILQIV